MKVISLFDGISCGRVALERANIQVEEYHAFEIDKYAIQVSQKNYPDIVRHGSVVEANFTQLKGFDLLFGGSPCQDLSIAKKDRQGLDGARSGLFWEYVRALKEVNPKYFLFENVASMPKEAKAVISSKLGCEPILINSALVSAQQRKRLYWTNIEGIEQPQDKGIFLRDILESGVVDRDKSYTMKHQAGNARDYFKKHHTQIVFEPIVTEEKSQSIKAQYGKNNVQNFVMRGSRHATGVFEPIRLGEIENTAKDPKSQQYRVYSIKGKSISLSGNGGGLGANTGLYYIDLPDGDYIIRKLTPIECERLQTLPDNYTAGISNTQRYKCCGNGWTIDVISHILKKLTPNSN